MSLYNISNKNLTALTQTTFAAEGLLERQDLQEALKGCIGAIAPDCLVISEEFSDTVVLIYIISAKFNEPVNAKTLSFFSF